MPSIDQLANMDELQLRNIEGFRVGRVGFGEVGWEGALPAGGPYTCMSRMTACPCILYQRLQVGLGGQLCAVYAVADMRRSVCITFHLKKCVFATQDSRT